MTIISLKTFKNEDKLDEFPEYDPERELEIEMETETDEDWRVYIEADRKYYADKDEEEGYDCPIHGKQDFDECPLC